MCSLYISGCVLGCVGVCVWGGGGVGGGGGPAPSPGSRVRGDRDSLEGDGWREEETQRGGKRWLIRPSVCLSVRLSHTSIQAFS